MAGLQVGGMPRHQALNAVEVALATPLIVTHHHETPSLSPSLVELRYDATQTVANLDAAPVDWHGVEVFAAYVLRWGSTQVLVPVAVSFSEACLSRHVERIAEEYDGPPQEPAALPAALGFGSPRPGCCLDFEATRLRLAPALVSASARRVDLVVDVEESPEVEPDLLLQLLEERLDDDPGLIPGVFIKDLRSGEEVTLNSDLAFSGLSVLKVAVLEEVYWNLDRPPDPETTKLISETVTESGNSTANLLLRDAIGDGDAHEATERLADSMRRSGLLNTLMGAPHDEKDPGREIVTDADVVVAAAMIDRLVRHAEIISLKGPSSRRKGKEGFTDPVAKNRRYFIVEWYTFTSLTTRIKAGVLGGTREAHKHGWTRDTYADAALV